jgi:hypothetical protein
MWLFAWCVRHTTYIHTYIHAYIHTYIDTYVYTCVYTCMHTYIHTYILYVSSYYIHTQAPLSSATTCNYLHMCPATSCNYLYMCPHTTRIHRRPSPLQLPGERRTEKQRAATAATGANKPKAPPTRGRLSFCLPCLPYARCPQGLTRPPPPPPALLDRPPPP